MQQYVVNWKMALPTFVTLLRGYLIWWTLIHKRRKRLKKNDLASKQCSWLMVFRGVGSHNYIHCVSKNGHPFCFFAITLSTASQFAYFLAHVHYRKFATGGYIVSPPSTVCVTALPCKILITTFPVCLYMFTTINNKQIQKICTLDMIHVQKRHNTD